MCCDTLMECAEKSELLDVSFQGFRCVEDQQLSSTSDLVDSIEEHDLLESLLDDSKPAIPVDCQNLHYLLYTPFRYPPLKFGSRFGSQTERSIFYGSNEIETTLAEVAFYQMSFLRASHGTFQPTSINFTTFSMGIKSKKTLDLSAESFKKYSGELRSVSSYHLTQKVGAIARNRKAELLLFLSARCAGKNFGLISPKAFSTKKPKKQVKWSASVSQHRVLFRAKDHENLEFKESDFHHKGAWPKLPS